MNENPYEPLTCTNLRESSVLNLWFLFAIGLGFINVVVAYLDAIREMAPNGLIIVSIVICISFHFINAMACCLSSIYSKLLSIVLGLLTNVVYALYLFQDKGNRTSTGQLHVIFVPACFMIVVLLLHFFAWIVSLILFTE